MQKLFEKLLFFGKNLYKKSFKKVHYVTFAPLAVKNNNKKTDVTVALI